MSTATKPIPFLSSRLRLLGYKTYRDYLSSRRWKQTRERFYADPHTPKACLCGDDTNLDLHHLTYERLGNEDLEDLHPLCPTCHNAVHVLARRGLMDLKLQGYVSDLRRARYARERHAALAVRGDRPDTIGTDRPYAEHNWSRNAKTRRANARDGRDKPPGNRRGT